MKSLIVYICFTGLIFPLLILFFNKGYRSANRFLAGFLFFASLYLLENFFFFYGESLFWIAFFTQTHPFFYLIGPFSFFYVRSIVRDNPKLDAADYLHFALFMASFTGLIPYFFSAWTYKIEIAQNLKSNNWNIAPYHINKIIPHILDQAISLLHIFFYAITHWVMVLRYKKSAGKSILNTPQYKLIRNWLAIFCIIFSVIAINFCFAMVSLWVFHEKDLFLSRANGILLFAGIVYVSISISLLCFPQLMYGLPLDAKKGKSQRDDQANGAADSTARNPKGKPGERSNNESETLKDAPQLFSSEYIAGIEEILDDIINQGKYLNPDFKLINISFDYAIQSHHLTYYFNGIRKISFSDWRNNLRIAHAKSLMDKGTASSIKLDAIATECGFSSQNTFTRAFKNETGLAPGEFLKQKSG